MKILLPLLILSACLFACQREQPNHAEVISKYYEAYNASDFNRLKELVADSFTISEGEYITPYTHDSFHEQFKWDSVFQPAYEILELKTEEDKLTAVVASTSVRYAFLKNNPLTCEFRFSFIDGKIVVQENLECPEADWNTWQSERDTLVAWISKNHPALDGFIHDLSMKGAINYVKAIELYQNREAGN